MLSNMSLPDWLGGDGFQNNGNGQLGGGNGPGNAQNNGVNGFGGQNNVRGLLGGAQIIGAGPNVNNYNNAYNYNLNLTTQQSNQSVQQSFAIMQMLAG